MGDSRSTKRKKLRFFKKELVKHMVNKPFIDVYTDDTAKQERQTFALRNWATRRLSLIGKIDELEDGFKNG